MGRDTLIANPYSGGGLKGFPPASLLLTPALVHEKREDTEAAAVLCGFSPGAEGFAVFSQLDYEM